MNEDLENGHDNGLLSAEESDALMDIVVNERDLDIKKCSRKMSSTILVTSNTKFGNYKRQENELVDKASFNTADFESINFTDSSTYL